MLNINGSASVARPALVEMLEPRRLRSAATLTTITSSDSKPEFGQTLELLVKVKTKKGKAVTKGTVELFVQNRNSGFRAEVDSKGAARFNFGPGDAIDISTETFYAHYVVNAGFAASTSKKTTVTIKAPTHFTTASNGLQTKTITAGKGAAVVKGDVVTFEDTGYDNTGKLIAESSVHTPPTASITVEATPEQTIPGFDEALVGMRTGEVRDIRVPSALGDKDGKTLTFVVELVSISK